MTQLTPVTGPDTAFEQAMAAMSAHASRDVANGTPRPRPNLLAATILAACGLPPEGGHTGITTDARGIDKTNGNTILVVELTTPDGQRVDDVQVVAAPRPMPALAEGLRRAVQYVDLSGRTVDRGDWDACLAAMVGVRVAFDVVHVEVRSETRARVINVRAVA